MMTYAQALRSSTRTPIYKIEWMDKNEIVVDETISDMVTGNISITLQNGIRRTCDLTLKNNDGKFTPNPDGLIYLEKKLKIYTGLIINGVQVSDINGNPIWNPQGVFNLGNPKVISNFSEQTVSIQCLDNYSLLDGSLSGSLIADYIIPVSSNLDNVVKQVFIDAGIPKSPLIVPTGITTPYTLTVEKSGTYSDLLTKLADMNSYEVFFDVNGVPRFQPPTNQLTQGTVWDFGTNESTYLGSTHNYDFTKAFNQVYVYGDNVNGGLYSAYAQDNNIFSPTSVARIGLKIAPTIYDSVIYSTLLCQQRADYELSKMIQMYESVDGNFIPIDIIKEGDMITMTDTNSGMNRDRYLVTDINLPIGYSNNMTMTIWKHRTIT